MVFLALLFAMAAVLNIVEGMLPPLPVPGMHFGLSNIPVMYSLFFVHPAGAFVLAILKGGLAFLTRGVSAGFLSMSGGLFSVVIMALLRLIFKDKISITILSVSGAVAHNLGQLIAATALYQLTVWGLAPILLLAGIASGILTAMLLKLLLPIFQKLNRF